MPIRDDLERELRRVRDRVSGLTLTQLNAGVPSRAALVHAAAQRIADLDAEAEARQPTPPLPQLSPFALADQLTVVTTDLLLATREGAAQEERLLNDALVVLVELRRAL